MRVNDLVNRTEGDAVARVLECIASDEQMRKHIETMLVNTFVALGLNISPKVAAQFRNKRFSSVRPIRADQKLMT